VKIETTGDDFDNKPLCCNNIPCDDSSQQTFGAVPTTGAIDQTMCLVSPSATNVAIPDTTLSCVPPSSSLSLCETNNASMVGEPFVDSSYEQMPPQIGSSFYSGCDNTKSESNMPASMVIEPYSGDEGIDYEDDEFIDFLEETFQC